MHISGFFFLDAYFRIGKKTFWEVKEFFFFRLVKFFPRRKKKRCQECTKASNFWQHRISTSIALTWAKSEIKSSTFIWLKLLFQLTFQTGETRFWKKNNCIQPITNEFQVVFRRQTVLSIKPLMPRFSVQCLVFSSLTSVAFPTERLVGAPRWRSWCFEII